MQDPIEESVQRAKLGICVTTISHRYEHYPQYKTFLTQNMQIYAMNSIMRSRSDADNIVL